MSSLSICFELMYCSKVIFDSHLQHMVRLVSTNQLSQQAVRQWCLTRTPFCPASPPAGRARFEVDTFSGVCDALFLSSGPSVAVLKGSKVPEDLLGAFRKDVKQKMHFSIQITTTLPVYIKVLGRSVRCAYGTWKSRVLLICMGEISAKVFTRFTPCIVVALGTPFLVSITKIFASLNVYKQ
ncbi:uncharacterized protein F5147DRAFT_654081 [Suillus discolor]|uniref:Uncharacterized protein n=1 Tax=Suillus discolor TaxID=1912936 RepID=A0A9P7F3C6_9AGAM|nr:uncharacterized protein F5147DRAFT_654081 [Suillus discolor]KAG2105840.1 hypothetical protein F5147DRAFT_654081 [Suillus discolor]